MEAVKSKRGGKRAGAGRKPKAVTGTMAPAKSKSATPAKSKAAPKSKPVTPVELPEKPFGRPTDYRPQYAAQTSKLCALGATDVELANFFEVNVSTIYLWSVRHKDFSEAKKLGKEQSDDRVEQSLYKRAMGYEHDEVDIRTVSSGPGMAEIVQTPIRKHYPPDTTAMIFWLKNRRREQWRDRIDVDAKVEMSLDDRLAALAESAAVAHAAIPTHG